MHFPTLTSTITPLLLSTTATALNFNLRQTFIPLPACLNVRTVLEATDTSAVVTSLLTEICSAPENAQPLPVDLISYNSLIRPFLEGVVTTEAANMGAPQIAPSYLVLIDALFDLARTRCGLAAVEGDVCAADQVQLQDVGDCIRRNGWQVAITNALRILPLFSLDACNRQVDFFGREEVVDVLVPQYARQFAAERRAVIS
ncbi:hypothetical protein BJX66DRAFT_225618 [Aspergillus keveii]|uniref:Uncharacterized protein n=1 Tax=Aspergillus keveii TaxID=714993 RepID=A0ABR4G326_9EURO